MKKKGPLSAAVLGICFLVALAAISIGPLQAKKNKSVQTSAQAVDAQGAPIFRVDPFWPKPLPNRWSMQQVTGLYVEEKNDHVWFLNRAPAADGDEIGGDGNPPRIVCCVRGPEADRIGSRRQCGAILGRPGISCPPGPTALQTIIVDREGNVWVARNRAARQHPEILARRKAALGFRPSPSERRAATQGEQPADRCAGVQGPLPTLDEDGPRNLHHQLEARAGLRHGYRRVQARLGRPRHAAERDYQRSHSALQMDRRSASGREEFRARSALRGDFARTGWCTSASAARTASRCSPSKANG